MDPRQAFEKLESYLLSSDYPQEVEDWLDHLDVALDALVEMEVALRKLAGAFNASKGHDPDKFTAPEWLALQEARAALFKLKERNDENN